MLYRRTADQFVALTHYYVFLNLALKLFVVYRLDSRIQLIYSVLK